LEALKFALKVFNPSTHTHENIHAKPKEATPMEIRSAGFKRYPINSKAPETIARIIQASSKKNAILPTNPKKVDI